LVGKKGGNHMAWLSLNETFEKCSILVKIKPPGCRAYGPEGKARISTTGI